MSHYSLHVPKNPITYLFQAQLPNPFPLPTYIEYGHKFEIRGK
jgi:hypothetical protein